MLFDFPKTNFTWPKRSRYQRCSFDDEHGLRRADAFNWGMIKLVALSTCSALVGGMLVMLGGALQASPNGTITTFSNSIVPVGVIESVFAYNRTFGVDPWRDPTSRTAWNSIVPLGRGTVQYPPNSHQFFTISAVHQIHCLWSIHQTLYAVVDGRLKQDPVERHMRHCFDYLRQSLMCAADTTLEPVDEELGGVTGWRVQRQCRNYEDLKRWAERNRASNAAPGFED